MPLYKGELDNIDPAALGLKLRTEGKDPYSHKNDPTEFYHGGNDDNPIWVFLNEFRENMIKAWYKEDRRLGKIVFDKRLAEFKESLPVVDDLVYVEFDSNKGKYHHYKIVYLAEDSRSVVGLSVKEQTLRVIGFPAGFATFYDKAPVVDDKE
jgi:hypothetical protein